MPRVCKQHVGTAALGCPAERSSAILPVRPCPSFAPALWTRTWGKRETSAAFLAAGWALPASLLAALIERPSAHSPVVLLLTRTLLFGLIPALACSSLPLPRLVPLAVALDLVLYRVFTGPLTMAHVAIEVVLFGFIFIPAQFFARWTITRRQLTARAVLHPIFHAGLLLGVLPALLVWLGLGGWSAPLHRSPWLNKIYAQLLLFPAVILISAVQ